jgi:hypothetical protein
LFRPNGVEYSIDRFGGDYRSFETTPDAKGKPCADAGQSGSPLPGLDLSPAGLRRDGAALLPQRRDQAATAPAVLHFGCGAVAR